MRIIKAFRSPCNLFLNKFRANKGCTCGLSAADLVEEAGDAAGLHVTTSGVSGPVYAKT